MNESDADIHDVGVSRPGDEQATSLLKKGIAVVVVKIHSRVERKLCGSLSDGVIGDGPSCIGGAIFSIGPPGEDRDASGVLVDEATESRQCEFLVTTAFLGSGAFLDFDDRLATTDEAERPG